MTEKDIQEQISELNRKMDLVLESVEQQKRNREEFDDLVEDLSIVARDAFKNTVVMLDKSQIDVDNSDIPMLLIKILQNVGTFHEMLEMLESARDFMKDISPVLHQVGLDAVNKMNELDQKGYFDEIAGIIRNLTQPGLLTSLNRTTKAIASIRMDDKLDNKSLFGIVKQLKAPDVRKSLSFALRLVEAAGRT